jgi:two-component system nitrate/nitrite response regulator NarL
LPQNDPAITINYSKELTMAAIFDNLHILIVADDPLARAGLATLVADLPNCTVVGQTAGDTDLLNLLDIHDPDVVVWDLGWNPTSTAMASLADLKADEFPVVALLPDESHATDAWLAGARGLLPRDVSADKLATALTAAAQGLATIEPEMVTALLPDTPVEPAALVEELTTRELEVLQLLAEGLPNKSIARQLDISEHTVKFHVNAIMSKLGAQSRTEAVVRATRLGLILL